METNKISSFIKTAISFSSNLRTTGALFQTSRKTEKNIAKLIKHHNPNLVVEYGAGLGNITKVILKNTKSECKIYIFEINPDFCEVLKKNDDNRLVVINDSAKNINLYLNEEIDLIISTIPFTLINKLELDKILETSAEQLKPNGSMYQVLYSSLFMNKLKKYFGEVSCKTLISLPFEFLYTCTKKVS